MKQYKNVDIYDVGENQKRAVFGVRNIFDGVRYVSEEDDVDLTNNETDPLLQRAKWKVRKGPAIIGFHDTQTDRFGVLIKLLTGETLTKRLIGIDLSGNPVRNGRSLTWTYGQNWIKQEFRAGTIKETVFQKKGVEIKFRFDTIGIKPKSNGDVWDLVTEANENAFSIEKPYYTNADGDNLGLVPVITERIDNNTFTVTYPAPTTDKLIDPTISIGQGVGSNKSTSLDSNNIVRSLAGTDALQLFNYPGSIYQSGLCRFDMTGLPSGAVVSSANLKLTLKSTENLACNYSISRLLYNWGVTDTNAGATQSPATGGQATWGYRFCYNDANNVPWSSGNISATDYDGAVNGTIPLSTASGTVFNNDVTALVIAMLANGNHGFYIRKTNTDIRTSNFYGFLAAAGNQPLLEIDYTLPASSRRIHKALDVGVGVYV